MLNKILASNISVFLETLPIIGICLLGIFGVTAFIILVVKLLNKGANWIEERNKK
jgi:hypothetical protein